MLFKYFYLLYLMIVVVGSSENTACIPNKLIMLSNCSFHYTYSNLTIDNRTLTMTVPYSLDTNEEESLFIKVLTRHQSEKSLIHFNLNLIQCLENHFLRWTSVESSSTLRGEFVRTTLTDTNVMYLSSGITYLRNLSTIDCATKTIYRTASSELFQINFKIESTLNDYCSNDYLCYPLNIYQCDSHRQRCACRSPLQSYLTKDQHSICVHAVANLDQCTIENVRCLPWCHQNSSSNMCLCPNDLAKKKYFDENRAYCEGRTNGVCNSLIQCPLGNLCLHGICRNNNYTLRNFLSSDLVTISIIVASIILFGLIILLIISLCILRRQRWKKHSHSSIDTMFNTKKEQTMLSTASDYDNIIYGVFRNNIKKFSTNGENIDDVSPYHPKIVFLGGEQQLTAIYA